MKRVLLFIGILALHAMVWSLPFWSPSPMGVMGIILWYIIFGGAVIYITYKAGKYQQN